MPNNTFHQKRTNRKNTKPGYFQKCFISPLSEFTAIAAPTPGGTGGAKITITGDHTFASTKGFYTLYPLPHKHTGKMETNGEAGALNPVYTQTVFIPGDSADDQVMLETIMNNDHIFLYVEPETGDVWQLGDENIPANVDKESLESGSTREGVKGYSVDIVGVRRSLYQGDITLATA